MEHITRELLEKEVIDANQLQAILDQYLTGPQLKPGTFAAVATSPLRTQDDAGSQSDVPQIG